MLCCFPRPARSWRSWPSCLSWWSWPVTSWTGTLLSSETTSASLSASQVGRPVPSGLDLMRIPKCPPLSIPGSRSGSSWFIFFRAQLESRQIVKSNLCSTVEFSFSVLLRCSLLNVWYLFFARCGFFFLVFFFCGCDLKQLQCLVWCKSYFLTN